MTWEQWSIKTGLYFLAVCLASHLPVLPVVCTAYTKILITHTLNYIWLSWVWPVRKIQHSRPTTLFGVLIPGIFNFRSTKHKRSSWDGRRKWQSALLIMRFPWKPFKWSSAQSDADVGCSVRDYTFGNKWTLCCCRQQCIQQQRDALDFSW